MASLAIGAHLTTTELILFHSLSTPLILCILLFAVFATQCAKKQAATKSDAIPDQNAPGKTLVNPQAQEINFMATAPKSTELPSNKTPSSMASKDNPKDIKESIQNASQADGNPVLASNPQQQPSSTKPEKVPGEDSFMQRQPEVRMAKRSEEIVSKGPVAKDRQDYKTLRNTKTGAESFDQSLDL